VEVRHHGLHRAGIVRPGIAGLRVQPCNLRHGLPQRILPDLQPGGELVVVLLGEGLELLLEDAVGEAEGFIGLPRRRVELAVHLEQ